LGSPPPLPSCLPRVKTFSSSLPIQIKLAALNATIAFLLVIEDPQQMAVFGDLLPHMLQIIAMALNSQDEDSARDAISAFIDLAESTPKFLKRSLDTLIPAMVQITSTNSVEDSTRHLAVELLITLTEKAPAMIRKYKGFVESVYPACWSLMVDIEDDSDWHTAEDVIPPFTHTHLFGKMILLNRRCCCLPD